MELTTLLDELATSTGDGEPSRVALSQVDVAKLVPIPYHADNLTHACEHGTLVTEYQFHSLVYVSSGWFRRNHDYQHDCVFEKHKAAFDLIDGRARALAKKYPRATMNQILRTVVKL